MMVDTPDQEIIDLLNEYSPIVRRIARSACYSSATIDLNDLHQIGDIAVIQAVKSYDPTCGTTIKSFVSRVVRNEIFHEAARFLGVFTVDHRVTSLASNVNKLYASGKDDEEIVDILSKSNNRKLDVEHVRDLRITYERRQHTCVEEDDAMEDYVAEEGTIRDILSDVIRNDTDKIILEERIMGDVSAKELAFRFNVTQGRFYDMENDLKERIKKAIEGATE